MRGGGVESDIISNADVFIHQDIRKENKFGYKLSDEYLTSELKADCINLTIPNLFGTGKAFYPQIEFENNHDRIYRKNVGLFPYKDLLVEKYRDLKISETISKYFTDDGYCEEEIRDNFHYHIKTLQKREMLCDIKISDFLRNKYKTERVFWDIGHPSGNVICEMCRQICKELEINTEKIKLDEVLEMDTYQAPILNSVKKVLGIVWEETELRQNTDNTITKMSLEEYIKQYLFWCYDKIFV